MKNSFNKRFQEFRGSKATLGFVKNPLNVAVEELNLNPFNIDVGQLELQLIELKGKELWSSKFVDLAGELEALEKSKCELSSQHKWSALSKLEDQDMIIFRTWVTIPDSFDQVKKLAFGVLSLFGSTYSCEQSFSFMNLIKNTHRSNLNDDSLECCMKLKTTSYKTEIGKLACELQGQKSH